jgi:hypothetical protein
VLAAAARTRDPLVMVQTSKESWSKAVLIGGPKQYPGKHGSTVTWISSSPAMPPPSQATRDPDRLRRYLEALAINSAGIVQDKTLYDAAGINQKAADAYE